jgi:hypothetical protein
VLSPSNTPREIADKARLSFAAGARQFWIVDIESRTVRVTDSDGSSRVCAERDYILLDALEPGAEPLPVAQSFAETE